MHIDECKVWITCEGQRLPEYDTQPEGNDGKTFACFMPSEAGKNFVLECQNNSASDVLKFTVKLDGISSPWTKWCKPQTKTSMTGIHTGPAAMQLFQFSQLKTTDAEDALHAPTNADLGTIRVEVQRVKLSLLRKPNAWNFTFRLPSSGSVHERSKKLGTHCITAAEATEADPLSSYKWKSEPINPEEGPVAEFIFRYRSLALLQAQDIAPRPLHSPAPSHRSQTGQSNQDDDTRPAKRQRVGTPDLESDSGIDLKPTISKLSDDDDELDILKGQLSQIMDRITKMERKKKRRTDGRSLKVKKEEPVASSSRLGAGSGEVIDLTLSD